VHNKLLLVAALAVLGVHAGAHAQDKVRFVTSWRAQGEHGGFYQAAATGLYRKHGLDVSIQMGGPQINTPQLLAAGAVDIAMLASCVEGLNYVNQSIPMVAIMTSFQKEPRVLITHPGAGNDRLEDLKGKPIYIATSGRNSFWPFLKAKFGYDDSQIRVYTFNLQPFLADQQAIMQGLITAEPFALQKQGVPTNVIVLANYGYASYANVIYTSRKMIAEKPDVVQRFVDASILGWYGYLYGDNSAANRLIKEHDNTMQDDQLAFTRETMLKHGLIDSGDSLKLGIGAMTDERWRSLWESTFKGSGLYPPGLDYKAAFTLQFVDKGVGVDLRKK
jgi:NitT/TauT family transport system substrate-binding protein